MGTVRYTVIDGEVVSELRGGVKRDYVPDTLGSTVALLDSSQSKTDTFEYWPYGESAGRTGTTSTPFQYVGTMGYYNDSSSKSYVRARYLDKAKGRWVTEDPLKQRFYGKNDYAYTSNKPVSVCDKTGLYGLGEAVNDLWSGNPIGSVGLFCGATKFQRCSYGDCESAGINCIDRACCRHDKCVRNFPYNPPNIFVDYLMFRTCGAALCAEAMRCAAYGCLKDGGHSPLNCSWVSGQIMFVFCNKILGWGSPFVPFW